MENLIGAPWTLPFTPQNKDLLSQLSEWFDQMIINKDKSRGESFQMT